MDLAELRIFKAVVDEGGVVKAARKLHRVPSNVTTRVKGLEAALGTELFIRDRKRLHLSPAGALLLAYADELLRLAEEARSAVAGSTPRGVLRWPASPPARASRSSRSPCSRRFTARTCGGTRSRARSPRS